jgi:hypothetical protein
MVIPGKDSKASAAAVQVRYLPDARDIRLVGLPTLLRPLSTFSREILITYGIA